MATLTIIPNGRHFDLIDEAGQVVAGGFSGWREANDWRNSSVSTQYPEIREDELESVTGMSREELVAAAEKAQVFSVELEKIMASGVRGTIECPACSYHATWTRDGRAYSVKCELCGWSGAGILRAKLA